MNQLQKYLKLVLWLQLMRSRQWKMLARYYGWIAFWSLLLIGGTLAELHACVVPEKARHVDQRLLVPLAALTLMGAYALGRWMGRGTLLVVGAITAGVFTITPRMLTWAPIATSEDGDILFPSFTEDPFLFIKGTVVCGCLLLLTVGVLRILKRQARHATHRTLLRQVTGRALIVITPLFLEGVRITAHLEFPVFLPWENAVRDALPELGWAYALAMTAWLSVSYLWADYDARILAHLLHRADIAWSGGELAVNDAFLVDRLLRRLPSLAVEHTRREQRRRSRRKSSGE